MSYTLFLDDIRFPENVTYFYDKYHKLTIARTMADAQWYVLHHGCPSFISFDHDLAEERYIIGRGSNTGYDFAKWFCNYILSVRGLPDNFGYHVHSMNPVGAQNIDSYMKNFLRVYYEN